MSSPFVKKLSGVTIEDVSEVGGKNASLGEMIRDLTKKGIDIPGGFAVTATAYRHFIKETKLDEFIKDALKGLKTQNLDDLSEAGSKIRSAIKEAPFPKDLEEAIGKAYKEAEKEYGSKATFAVRSSATAEDLPGASFAGEHETYLHIHGIENILESTKAAMASLFNDRAISYRVDKGFDHFKVALSVGIQKMIRSDLSCSGIMFSLDTETGFPGTVIINASWGLGEMIVQGKVTPDEYLIFKGTLGKEKPGHLIKRLLLKDYYLPIIDKKLGDKQKKMVYSRDESNSTKVIETTGVERENFTLTDSEVLKLAKWAVQIEKHYSDKYKKWTPMDMEWAKDGEDGKLYIVQARPETIHSERDMSKIKVYERSQNGKEIVKGASVGNKIAAGKANLILDTKHIKDFEKGEILVTEITDPDWEPIMKLASAIVTDKGGRTSHAAIVARELGIPAVVGCKDATSKIKKGQMITVDTTGSDGIVFEGEIKFKIEEVNTKNLPETKTHIMINIATPDTAFEKSFLPNKGVGLAREEFIIASYIGIHPLALLNYKDQTQKIKDEINKKTLGYDDKVQFYIDKLAYGIAKIGAAFYPHPVIVRFSDFKTNEYRTLIGGEQYEPQEENPMIGWRGASRYYHPDFAPAFALEVKSILKVRNEMGLNNVMVMCHFAELLKKERKLQS